jgi:D-alanyl-D-alanine carboxypeptidase (penicillin-binding protein 5/6)
VRTWIIAGLAFLTATLLAYGGYAAAAPAPAAHAQESDQTLAGAPARIEWPSQAAAAVGVVGRPGLLAGQRQTDSVPTASMAKAVTALVIVSKKPLAGPDDPGPMIRFTVGDKRIQQKVVDDGGSWASVTPGVAMSERQALETMLLPSANNYAISLARWAFGSESDFRAAANAWLAAHRLRGTHLDDATGLSPKTRSTPTDLVEIAKLLRENSALSAIVAMPRAEIPGAGVQENRNILLGVAGIDGIKTGNTPQAGFCLLFSTTLHLGGQSRVIVGVVAGEPDFTTLFHDVTRLVESVRSGFHLLDLTGPGKRFGDYDTPWGQHAALVAPARMTMITWSDTPVTVRVTARPVTSAGRATQVGTVTFSVEGAVVATRPLSPASAIRPPSLAWRLTHPPRRR